MTKRRQVRLTFDEHMGPFFTWLDRLDDKVRARELTAMTRAGYAVVHGARVPGAQAALGPEAGGNSTAPVRESAQARAPARKAAVDTFGASFLVATPPLQ